eukprot:CAMPEP_0167766224 /NCGR_PEP_ID=MMETSP0110_2-20121227/15210_1 /TAXON_ID=629695 /ORGANISM="Gymnochlora sp., Strain CCMP2014" /LENGTH=118 /DNA_ID=CAMNT_0007654197 /DNA_START=75 /DNA_END=429 /DNA_ORIENTATION=+
MLVSPFMIHRNPNSFKSPNLYNPRRWLKDGECPPWAEILKEGTVSGNYIPFGAGPRVCIGTGFAMMEMMIVLRKLFSTFEFRPCSPFPATSALITLRPMDFQLEVLPDDISTCPLLIP